ncbi:MAG: hypothetical protein HYU63_05375 [Armatimonadetes bacterium]|nr:hypothetical protein [Armatimonadota bacterium]
MDKTEKYLQKFKIITLNEKFKENLKIKLKELLQGRRAEFLLVKKLAFANTFLILLIAAIIFLYAFTPEHYTEAKSVSKPIIISELKDVFSPEYIIWRINISNKSKSLFFADKNKLLNKIFKEE